MKVRDIMTRDVISVGTTTPLREVALILAESRISGVVVVDESRTPVGIVSEGDLLAKQLSRPAKRRDALEWIFGEHADADELRRRAAVTAAEAMSAPVVTIDADRPLREVAALMVDRDVNRLPVMADGVLAGIVTRADMVRAYLALDDEIASTIREQVLRRTCRDSRSGRPALDGRYRRAADRRGGRRGQRQGGPPLGARRHAPRPSRRDGGRARRGVARRTRGTNAAAPLSRLDQDADRHTGRGRRRRSLR
jgi:CBS domain-containing protein